ncbi:MAG: tryptophan synthase subunit alpha [Candidatus Omnitrophica bacterium]|nr:tryptophan synthase subunit alpha [Candidatus Omnitrophota bacterium]MDD5487462.1 tryptophan synthase subunit alpha [Candidatus Omnitrophota bacterium]
MTGKNVKRSLSSNRIVSMFERLAGRKALITYITAGDPDLGTTEKLVRGLAGSGADMVELGIPFSDPMADGPTIQRAIHRSLTAGCTVKKVLDLVKRTRKSIDVPIAFMTYYNIIFTYGVERFARAAASSGADGIIVPDLPMEEAGLLEKACRRNNVCLIMLAAPTTSMKRTREISNMSGGFLYYVSLTGVTGERTGLAHGLKSRVEKLRKISNVPVCVGFGISTPAQARDIASVSDGVIVGSAVIKIIEKNLGNRERMLRTVRKFVRDMADAVHAAKG